MRIAFLLLAAFFVYSLYAQEAPSVFELTLTISGFENTDGHAMVALVNSKENWNSKKESYKNAMPKVTGRKIVLTFTDLPKGEYAVKVFHDKNDNKELDTNFIGIPSEAYGFSNNARGRFGPADWDDAKFELSTNKSITIHIE